MPNSIQFNYDIQFRYCKNAQDICHQNYLVALKQCPIQFNSIQEV